MAKISLLGTGMVGRAIALDLQKNHHVSAFDLKEANFEELKSQGVVCSSADLTNDQHLASAISNADLVVSAVPGFLGFKTLEKVIPFGKPIVDISFFPEDPFALNQAAVEAKIPVIVDCGVAPGLDNILLGHHASKMEVNRFRCLVGGLPIDRSGIWQYKAPFSPIDVIEEYTRPARIVSGGKEIIKEPLTDSEMIDFEGIGTLEAFNSDGLRSLIRSFPDIPDMIEKTLRYPGHIDRIIALKEAGMFSEERVQFEGQEFRPLDLTAKILIDQWKLQPEEPELTVMRVEIEGPKENHSYDLLDHYDPISKTSSMARTTGYTCTSAVDAVLNGLVKGTGILAPEDLGKQDLVFEHIIQYLEKRKVLLRKNSQVK